MSGQKNKLGLALGSGGPRGLAHIGVLKFLISKNLKPNFLAGSSIGAWVAAHYAVHENIDKLIQDTLGNKWEKFYSLLEPAWSSGLIQGHRLEKLLQNFLGTPNFEDLKIPLTIVATDYQTGQIININSGPLLTALRGSMAVPPIFQPVKYQNYFLIDGALSNPVPVQSLKAMGANQIIAVNLNQLISDPETKIDLKPSLTQTSRRSLNIIHHHLADLSCAAADVVITPQLKNNGFKSWRQYFTGDHHQQIIEQGFLATETNWPKIKNLLN
ncbi:patatin-like phospholipase family protein [Patescibacteria group bacterium]|nr:patatin-like phospholipase family protein [Patescibacteria group bacterium]